MLDEGEKCIGCMNAVGKTYFQAAGKDNTVTDFFASWVHVTLYNVGFRIMFDLATNFPAY